jgi:hypothetical protein
MPDISNKYSQCLVRSGCSGNGICLANVSRIFPNKWFVADDAISGDKLALARYHLKRVQRFFLSQTRFDLLGIGVIVG